MIIDFTNPKIRREQRQKERKTESDKQEQRKKAILDYKIKRGFSINKKSLSCKWGFHDMQIVNSGYNPTYALCIKEGCDYIQDRIYLDAGGGAP